MNDLISRQAAIDATWFEPSYTDPLNVLTEVRDRLKVLPSAQPEITRCRDCKHWKANIPEVGFCVNKKHVTISEWKAIDYCSHAERKE